MNTILRSIVFVCVGLVCTASMRAQQGALRAGNKAYEALAYVRAIDNYERCVKAVIEYLPKAAKDLRGGTLRISLVQELELLTENVCENAFINCTKDYLIVRRTGREDPQRLSGIFAFTKTKVYDLIRKNGN